MHESPSPSILRFCGACSAVSKNRRDAKDQRDDEDDDNPSNGDGGDEYQDQSSDGKEGEMEVYSSNSLHKAACTSYLWEPVHGFPAARISRIVVPVLLFGTKTTTTTIS